MANEFLFYRRADILSKCHVRAGYEILDRTLAPADAIGQFSSELV